MTCILVERTYCKSLAKKFSEIFISRYLFVSFFLLHICFSANIMYFRHFSSFLGGIGVRHLNANRSAVTRTKRELFMRKFPTLTVLPNGATITIKYPEPRRIIKVNDYLCMMNNSS